MEIRSLTHTHNNNNCWANYVFQHDFKNQNARQVFVAAVAAAVATIIRQKPTDTTRCWTNENMCSVCVRVCDCIYGLRACQTCFVVCVNFQTVEINDKHPKVGNKYYPCPAGTAYVCVCVRVQGS